MSRKVPETTKQLVLLESGYRCANPTCRSILTLEIHHIEWVKDKGANTHDNLIPLCPTCHALHTQGSIPKTAIVTWKSILVSLNNPNRSCADVLLVLYQAESNPASVSDETSKLPPMRFSGDSLGFLASLITANLVKIGRYHSGSSWFGGGSPTFEVHLTETGKQFVDSWLNGRQFNIFRAT